MPGDRLSSRIQPNSAMLFTRPPHPTSSWQTQMGRRRIRSDLFGASWASADIYFVVNTSNRKMDAVASFATTHKYGEQWNGETPLPRLLQRTLSRFALLPMSRASLSFQMLYLPASPLHCNQPVPRSPISARIGRSPLHQRERLKSSRHPPILQPIRIRSITRARLSMRVTSLSSEFRPARFSLKSKAGKPLPGAPNSPPEHAVPGANGLPNPLITRPGPGMRAYFDPPIREAALVTINGQSLRARYGTHRIGSTFRAAQGRPESHRDSRV